jgi:hypothetical protein
MAVFDFKKEYKALYLPKTTPSLIEVPVMTYLMINGKGNPNTEPSYKKSVEALYSLAYAIKMSKMGSQQPEGYFDFVVPPLEGLWWLEGQAFDGTVIDRKDDFQWIMMLRQPEFVNAKVFESTKIGVVKNKPDLDLRGVRLETFAEGLCAQIMHMGPYDAEPASIAQLDTFIQEKGFRTEMHGMRQHHEIYLSDPNKTEPEKLKTVIRHPVVIA